SPAGESVSALCLGRVDAEQVPAETRRYRSNGMRLRTMRADDAIVHGRTEAEAQEVRAATAARMEECRLELHPEKTKVVYCKDDDRRRRYPNEKFDFLGYGFQPRRSKNRFGKYFINFSPAISDKAGKSIR